VPTPKPRYIHWSELHSVGDGLLDTEHHHLVDLINEFYDIVSAASTSGRLEPALRSIEEILSYTDYHFNDEERLLGPWAYPDIEAHRAQHHRLRTKTWELHNQFLRSPTRGEALGILAFLRGWWTSHINHTDTAYAAYLAASAARTSAAVTSGPDEDAVASPDHPAPVKPGLTSRRSQSGRHRVSTPLARAASSTALLTRARGSAPPVRLERVTLRAGVRSRS
jgi:hemerythrin